MITGQYNERGYRVYDDKGEVYSAGNHPHDSQQCVELAFGVPLGTLKRYCQQTMDDEARAEDMRDRTAE